MWGNPHRKSTINLWNNRRFAPEINVILHCRRHQRTFQASGLRRNGIRAALTRFVWSTMHPHTKTGCKRRLCALSGIMPQPHPGFRRIAGVGVFVWSIMHAHTNHIHTNYIQKWRCDVAHHYTAKL
jgi:hypothetical protein